jgi:dUTP pyrophosphatase
MSTNEAKLFIYIDPYNAELREVYEKHIFAHNAHIDTDPFSNSGFDLILPKTHVFGSSTNFAAEFIDFEIKTEMQYEQHPSAFYVFLRSSVSKTPLMLANHTGVIDSGYRGNIKGAFRNLQEEEYTVEKHSKILQICHPSLCKIRVFLQDIITETSRGEGSFGSTGK